MRLPASPGKIEELIPFGAGLIYVRTFGGGTYRYDDWHAPGWVQEPIPQSPNMEIDVERPCDQRRKEFLESAKPPNTVASCVYESVLYADAVVSYTYVLDTDGYIWQTDGISRRPSPVPIIISSGIWGLVAGTALGACAILALPKAQSLLTHERNSACFQAA